MAEELDLVAGGFAGEPVGLVGVAGCGRWGEFAVDGEGGFEGDEGGAGLDEVGEGFVDVAGLLLEVPMVTSMLAARSLAMPWPLTSGLGSVVAMTQRVMPAAMRASAQGPVRPWWLQGSRVT